MNTTPRPSWRAYIFEAGFRPFFLLTALQAGSVAVIWAGWLGLSAFGADIFPAFAPPPMVWHGHEMLFGFLSAAVAGFLLTAVPNWTNTPPVKGPWLMALVGAWLAGRAAFWLSDLLPVWAVIGADMAFWPLLIGLIARALRASPSRRNHLFIVLLSLLASASFADHLGLTDIIPGLSPHARLLAGNIVVLMMVIIGGRITPTFSRNWLAARKEALPAPLSPRFEVLTIISVALVMVTDLILPLTGVDDSLAQGFRGVLAGCAAAFLAYRVWRWQPWRVAAEALLWVLHLGAAWLAIGFALRCWALLSPLLLGGDGGLGEMSALHAHFAGAAGTLVLGVMGRASRGHSGLPLSANRIMVVSYLIISLSAALRVFGPILFSHDYLMVVSVASGLWSLGFLLFLYDIIPIIGCRPSEDKPF